MQWDAVDRHYRQDGLVGRLIQALQAAGHDIGALDATALAGAEEFHLGGRPATEAVIADLELGPDAHVLDVGCGIGGPARTIARSAGCHVTGIDITRSFIASATALSRLVGLSHRTSFVVGNALELPFEEQTFDATTLIHAGMNIEDKTTLLAEMARVVRPGGAVVVYDIMRIADGELVFPLPWASEPTTSFVASPQTYEAVMREVGLSVERTTDRTAMCLELVSKARANPPKINLSDLMGPRWPTLFSHLLDALEAGIVAPIEMVARV